MTVISRRSLVMAMGIVCLGLSIPAPSAQATSGPGCFRIVNVADGDVLNVRVDPSFKAPLAGTMDPKYHGIIALEGDCVPLRREPEARWCRIRHFTGGGTTEGWVKRRYLQDIDCP